MLSFSANSSIADSMAKLPTASPGARKAALATMFMRRSTCAGAINSLSINPYDYFVDVLQRIRQHPASLVHQLTPRIWKQMFAANPLRSGLHDLAGRRTYAGA
jgi:hypothetical protein